MSKKLTQEEIIKRFHKVHGDNYDYKDFNYQNIKTKGKIFCKKCGHYFWQRPEQHLSGNRCPYCYGTPKKTLEQFILEANYIHHCFYSYNHFVYTNNSIKSYITCPIHGDFLQTPANHLQGQGCPECRKIKISKSKLKNLEQFVLRAKIIHNNFYTYENFIYINNKTKSYITCPIHGDFLQTPNDHLTGYGCPYCGREKIGNSKRKSLEQFIQEANKIHNNFYDYSLVDYKNNKIAVKIICPIHGEFEQVPSDHLGGHGCPHCNESQGEKIIARFLLNKNIKFERQKTFDDCKNINHLPFDFYLPELNICIEYDGQQHFMSVKHWGGDKSFEKIQIRDKIKNEYCINNNIKLIRIKYDENIEEVLNEELKKGS